MSVLVGIHEGAPVCGSHLIFSARPRTSILPFSAERVGFDQLRPRVPTDVQHSGAEPHRTRDELLLVVLSVDDVDATWCDDDVVDVGATPRNPSVMYDAHSVSGKSVKHAAQESLAFRAG